MGGDICIYTVVSFHCMAETNTVMQCNYTSVKTKNFLNPKQTLLSVALLWVKWKVISLEENRRQLQKDLKLG